MAETMNDLSQEALTEFSRILLADAMSADIALAAQWLPTVHYISRVLNLPIMGRQELIVAGFFWVHKTGHLVYTERAVDMALWLKL